MTSHRWPLSHRQCGQGDTTEKSANWVGCLYPWTHLIDYKLKRDCPVCWPDTGQPAGSMFREKVACQQSSLCEHVMQKENHKNWLQSMTRLSCPGLQMPSLRLQYKTNKICNLLSVCSISNTHLPKEPVSGNRTNVSFPSIKSSYKYTVQNDKAWTPSRSSRLAC